MSDEKALLNRLLRFVDPNSAVIIGLGNPDRADDGAGIQIVANLKARFPERAFLESEKSAEGLVFDFLEKKSAKTVLFVDAVDFEGKPGEIKFFDSRDAEQMIPAISTHQVPLPIVMKLIEKHSKDSYLIGIQPKSIQLFGEVSVEVGEAIQNLVKHLTLFLSQGK